MRPSDGPGSIDVAVRVFSYDSGASGPELTRAVAVEAPVQIVIGGAPFAVMMATPSNLEDFAYGFALTEQIANIVADIRGVEVEAVEAGWKLKIAISGERLQSHLARGRAMSGRTGCGLCGAERAEDAIRECAPVPAGVSVSAAELHAAIAQLSGEYAQVGWLALLGLMANISLNLGLLNLLPIPILDGGVILFLLIEGLMRRDISINIKERVYQAAFVFLVLFAVMVIYNDLMKTIPGLADRLP